MTKIDKIGYGKENFGSTAANNYQIIIIFSRKNENVSQFTGKKLKFYVQTTVII